MKPLVTCRDVCFSFGDHHVVNKLNLQINEGEKHALLGASGCGKTTLLNLIGGIYPVDSGEILLKEKTVSGSHFVPAEKRNIGRVFQDYALFPHLSVGENVSFGLKGKIDRELQIKKVSDLLAMVGLSGFTEKSTLKLSGGQKQRVSLARALAIGPELMLLDEPFSNLDVSLRQSLRSDIKKILSHLGMTSILVTHDLDEAFSFADRVSVMVDGYLAQTGTPIEIYEKPASKDVVSYLNQGALLPGNVMGLSVETDFGSLRSREQLSEGQDVLVWVRPDQISLDSQSPHLVHVEYTEFLGAYTRVFARTSNGHPFSFQSGTREELAGKRVGVTVKGIPYILPGEKV